MKNLYIIIVKASLTLLSALIIQVAVAQPTTLVAGDIAFTGYNATANSPQPDAFSFVLLRAMNAGTIIRFTDNAFGNDLVLRTNEQTVSLTLAGNYPAGVEITVSGAPNATTIAATIAGGSTSAGTATGNMLSLSVNGDQVIAYQSAVAGTAPFTFISGIHMNVYNGGLDITVTDATNWDNAASGTQTTNSSFKPTGLTTGTNAIWIGTQGNISSERNNARFNCNTAIAGGANLLTIAGIRAACNNPAFWDAEFAASGAATSWPLPSTCNYMNILIPVQLISFQAKNNLANVDVQWQVANQQNVSHYEVERSFDNRNFEKIGMVTAKPGTGNITYHYADAESLKNSAAIIYYRLKSVDLDAKFSYSEIVSIRNKKGSLSIDNLLNPVKDKLVFTLASKAGGLLQVQLTDMNGRILATRALQVGAGSATTVTLPEAAALARGMYLLKVMSDGESTVTRFIK
jgi:hypothetical protein